MIFFSMYSDYWYHNIFVYFIAAVFPGLFIQQKRYILISFLMSCVVSSLLVKMYIPPTDTFFYPFDNIRTVLVVGESMFFAGIQFVILLAIRKVKELYKSRR